mgnify:FL=1
MVEDSLLKRAILFARTSVKAQVLYIVDNYPAVRTSCTEIVEQTNAKHFVQANRLDFENGSTIHVMALANAENFLIGAEMSHIIFDVKDYDFETLVRAQSRVRSRVPHPNMGVYTRE